MASKIDFVLPFNDLNQYVPSNLRNPVISGLISNLFNRMMTHDESVPLYGYVGQKPTAYDDQTVRVPQPTVERDINAIIPVLHFKQGTETQAFTVQDIIRKAETIGVKTAGQRWLYSQANNYLPPINIDKFANYFNYFWLGDNPEYYAIARPADSDLNKLSVVAATTAPVIRTGSGFVDQRFRLTFVDEHHFSLQALDFQTHSLSGYTVIATSSQTIINSAIVGTNPETVVDSSTLSCALSPMPTVSGVGGGSIVYDVFYFKVRQGSSSAVQLLKLTIQRNPILDEHGAWIENERFADTDTFTLTTQFISTTYSLSYFITQGLKGRIVGVDTLGTYQSIDGVTLVQGQRVLVKDNSLPENGIYIVGARSWSRASDYNGAHITAGARVWASNGTSNIGKLFTSSAVNTWAGVVSASNTNDWREGNRWYNASEITALGGSSAVTQASRPIIEYDSNLQLNGFVTGAGIPSDAGYAFKQTKDEFNQLPMFDLFRYDGTHAGRVSSIFFYADDSTANLDLTIQKRVKSSSTDSADYIFNHGLVDENGNSLFYKINGRLHGIWHAGYSTPTVIDTTFVGKSKGAVIILSPFASATPQTWTLSATSPTTFIASGSISGPTGVITVGGLYSDSQLTLLISDGQVPFLVNETFTFDVLAGPIATAPVFQGSRKGTLNNVVASSVTQQQVWTLVATDATTFSVTGSKMATLPIGVNTITVGVPYVSANFSCLIVDGTQHFDAGDTFTIRIGNADSPRYVYRKDDDTISDLYGGQSSDVAGIGAYQVSRSFINNPYNDAADEVLEGSLYGHFRSILMNQPANTTQNMAFGGIIKSWSEQHSLLASLLMQKDSTPISVIDLAQKQYESGLGMVADIFKQNIAQYFVDHGVVDFDASAEQEARVIALVDYILSIRATDDDVRRVLYDSTSGVIGFPATLPQLGVLPRSLPRIDYNTILGVPMLFHHDGHNSSLWADSNTFREQVLDTTYNRKVKLADGSEPKALGGAGATPPSNPFNGMLWIHVTQGTSIMYAYDSTLGGWRVINLADTLNQVLLRIEQRLYDRCNPNARVIFDGSADAQAILSAPDYQAALKKELFLFATRHNFDPLGSDFNAANALTWNYTGATLSPGVTLNVATTPARWYDVLEAHQRTVSGVLVTHRPNVEPWRLLGYNTFADWLATEPALVGASLPYATPDDLGNGTFYDAGFVRVVKTTGTTLLAGLQVIDGIALRAGDRVLLVGEAAAANNGIWTASAGAWSRPAITLLKNIYVSVLDGNTYNGTQWVLHDSVASVGVDAVNFLQVRYWNASLWVEIQTRRPTLKLSVDTVRDVLLPPYVSAEFPARAANALTTIDPISSKLLNYSYGQNSPVETVWKTTSEYRYALVRALFKYDPLLFLSYCWGYNWVEVDGLLYDGYDISIPGHKRFLLHGDEVRKIDRTNACSILSTTLSGTITYDAYEVAGGHRYQNFTVRNASGVIIGYAREGTTTSLPNLIGLRIDDFGQPFHKGDTFNFTPTTITFSPALRHVFHGFGQTFTHALRQVSIDSSNSYAIDAYRNWDVDMGYRVGGLVATDDLVVYTDSSSLTTSSYDLIVKKNSFTRDLWIYGLRISVTIIGENIRSLDGLIHPKTDAADWTFRIENYNPLHTEVKYYNVDSTGTFETFNVLDKSSTDTVWRQYTQNTGVATANFPMTITGVQNVVNFLFGYTQKLLADGWRFALDLETNTDAETGRIRTWQLEIEKFLNTLYLGITEDQGIVVTPFADQLWIQQDTGLLSEFTDTGLFDINVHPAVFDLGGRKLRSNEIYTIRGNKVSRFGGDVAMFSAHAQLDDYEHLFIFGRYVESSINNGVLYQPFTGARVVTYKFNGRRQGSETMRPEYGGHYLVGNEVRQNLQASTDNIAAYYDASKAFETTQTTRHALALLGFNTKTYFENLDIQEKSQFNFWRGMIQMKGTNTSVTSFLNNNRFKDAKIDEYWAYKIAEYGDARERTFPELKLKTTDTVQQFTQLQFDSKTLENEGFKAIYNDEEARWFSIDDLNLDTFFKAAVVGTYNVTVANGATIKLPFIADTITVTDSANLPIAFTMVNATTLTVPVGGAIRITGYGAATPKYSPMKLINYVANELVEEIPFWHPAAGQHNAVALESINIMSTLNPAKYNVSTKVANNNSFDPLRPWGDKEIGRIWFDTTNLAYLPYYDDLLFTERSARLSRWGALTDYATIDIYEWVQSAVPPSEYNALALEQAGNADLDSNTKAAGEVALQQTYLRDRKWSIRPIAWSRTGVPIADAHPAFQMSGPSRLFVGQSAAGLRMAWLEVGLFTSANHNITIGSHIGAWDFVAKQPTVESVTVGTFFKHFVDATEQPIGVRHVTVGGISFDISIEMLSYTDVAGPLLVSHLAQDDDVVARLETNTGVVIYDYTHSLRVTEVDSGQVETVAITQSSIATVSTTEPPPPTETFVTGERQVFDLPTLGLRISATVTTGGNAVVTVLRDALATALAANVTVRDAVYLSDIAGSWPSGASSTLPAIFSNDINEGPHRQEWCAWNVPTQAQLDADGKQPNSAWKPYQGELLSATFSLTQVQDAVAYAKAPLTLNDGTVIERYASTWTDWSVIMAERLTATQLVAGDLTLTAEATIIPSRTSVYVDGVIQLSARYEITEATIKVFAVGLGSTVFVLIRKYEPSAAELAFNPDVKDDLTFQHQYKKDYEYVILPTRDIDGAPSSPVYYFWVTNKTVAARNKKLSTNAIAQALRDGPVNYLTFQHLLPPTTIAPFKPYRYDAITISNLSYVVGKDDTFKLRFTRNFTLRDDPNQLDLKDTHTEWTLIRSGQRTAIPEALWLKLTDSLAGQDAAGNAVPAQRRIGYDERNGTRTQFGFGPEQTLAPRDLLLRTITKTIVNTQLVDKSVPPSASGVFPADFITALDFSQQDKWFETAAAARKTMTTIWTAAKPAQINEIFFGALDDLLASNFELTDIFKTSRLSVYSIRVVNDASAAPTYD